MQDNQYQPMQPKKITIGFVLSWIFGIFFLLGGLAFMTTSLLAGVIYFLLALYILPPINAILVQKTGFHLSGALNFILVIIVMSVAGIVYSNNLPAKTPELVSKQSSPNQNNSQQSISQSKKETKSDNTPVKEIINNSKVEESVEKDVSVPIKNEVKEEVKKETEAESVPTEYKSALSKATTYANTMNMSKKGVYDQLMSEYGEKFSAPAAQYAIDNVKSDWNENALAKAKVYQDRMKMSPNAIRDQLVSDYGEKFTAEEADYAVKNLDK